MTSRFAVLAIDALDPARIADLWARVLGWQIHEADDAGSSFGPASCGRALHSV